MGTKIPIDPPRRLHPGCQCLAKTARRLGRMRRRATRAVVSDPTRTLQRLMLKKAAARPAAHATPDRRDQVSEAAAAA